MDQIDSLRVFARVAETGSFTQAALNLGLTKASVSVAVQRLESQLGARLLHRTTRQVQLTPDGALCYQRALDLLADADELRAMFQAAPADLRGRIRVDMAPGAARAVVLPRLPEFIALHPGVTLELGSTDRQVDLVHEGFDCVLRAGALADSSLIARRLGHYRQISCASPAYLARHGTPRQPEDLARHQLIHYSPTLAPGGSTFDYLDPAGGQVLSLAMGGPLTVNNSAAYVAACLAGLGIIQAPLVGIRQHLEEGSLVVLLPDHPPPQLPVNLLYPNRRNLPRRVQVFMHWLADVVSPHLDPVAEHGPGSPRLVNGE